MAQIIGFWDRFRLACRVLLDGEFAGQLQEAYNKLTRMPPATAAVPPERVHSSGLMLLAAFQREGRLVDFLRQEVAGFSDEDIGAAARVVHAGCRRTLDQFFQLEPAVQGTEGLPMGVPAGFDAQRVRLTGNVSGQPPFNGTLKHHGWIATEVRMPAASEVLDPRVIAPAEVELP